LDVSVSAFRTAVESQFIEAARLHRTAIGDISDSAERLSRTTDNLRTGSDELHGAISAHSGSFQELGRALSHSLEIDLVPTHQKLRATVNSFDSCVAEFTACMRALRSTTESLSGNIETATRDIGSLAGQLQPTVTAFREAVDDQFTSAAGQHEKNLKTLATSLDQIEQMGQTLSKSATVVEKLLEQHTGLAEQIEPAQVALRSAMDRIAHAGDAFEKTMDDRVIPSQQAMGEAADSFATSADRLTAFIEEGVDPATHRLVALDQTLSRLEGTVDALREFSGVRTDIEQLAQSLARAATVADAISALPGQIREILEELVATHRDEMDNSRGNWLGFLRHRSHT
jgi:chromosome segregation ATPase